MSDNATSQTGPLQTSWLLILGLIGVDYFSSLAYQPSIAFEAAGFLAPLATVVVVLFTFLGALPVYAYVAGRSPHGQGAAGLLERAVPGWIGKLLILILLGFAATDFVVTRTLSVADAAEHLIYNPQPAWQRLLDHLGHADDTLVTFFPRTFWDQLRTYWNRQLVVTVLLSILGFLFWAIFRRGFTRRVIHLSAAVVLLYLLLSALVIGNGLNYLVAHPDLLSDWWAKLAAGHWHPDRRFLAPHAWLPLALLCLVAFPSLALGLSGFELSMVVMPLIKGDPCDTAADPRCRIRNVRKLLFAAGAIMALYLLGSALVTTILIPPAELTTTGAARNRALAYLAHGGKLADGETAAALSPLFGPAFGTAYDVVTIVILCLAGASVALGLRDFVPQYLHRLGMELDWAHRIGLILYLFNCINLVVTVIFRASVTAQRGAYAASVLTMITGAAVTAVLDLYRRRRGSRRRRIPWTFVAISVIFGASAVAAIVANPSGLLIALGFIHAIVISSILSRALRCTELRFMGFEFKDAQSQFLWDSLKYLEFPVLIPHRPGLQSLDAREKAIRERHHLAAEVPVVFVEAHLGDASDFYHRPHMEIIEEEGRFIIRVARCASIPHVIAAIALELSKVGKPPEIHFGWSNERPIEANVNFLLFGQGNIPWMVRDLIRRAEPDAARQPPTIIG
ncbi:MAG: amino acid transporter [Planctomycetota bacterium]|nr:MAG: amino acid transporter [Planctomycetota bacterium]